MNKLGNTLWGIIFITLGLIFGLNALDITNINIFFDGWWTLVIIIPCLMNLIKKEHKTGNLIGLIIGILLLLCCQNIIEMETILKLFFPAIFIIIGLSFLLKDTFNKNIKKEMKNIQTKNKKELEYCATFGVQNLEFSEEKFSGCTINSIFGEVNCDLTDALIEDDIVIEASAIFGEINIIVPKDKNVKINSTPIFGSATNKRKQKYNNEYKTIYINATCLFGGVEVK